MAWYQKRSPKAAADFVEELHRATETIRATPDRRPEGKNNTRQAVSAVAFSFFHYLFGAGFYSYCVGRGPRQQAP